MSRVFCSISTLRRFMSASNAAMPAERSEMALSSFCSVAASWALRACKKQRRERRVSARPGVAQQVYSYCLHLLAHGARALACHKMH